jgi:hypothetical protein
MSRQPALTDLLSHYLQQQGSLAADRLEPVGEVVPHEAIPAQPVNARLAWDEAIALLPCFSVAQDRQTLSEPPGWAAFVAAQEPVAALAFCVGNYPQLVRELPPLLRTDSLAALRPAPGRPLSDQALLDWAATLSRTGSFPQTLIALGVLRVGRNFDAAAELQQRHQANVPVEWKAAWANEQAALTWHSGQVETARDLWQVQPASVPVLFNRGLAALFLDRPAEARPLLKRALAQLTEENGWHHLAGLYLALAEMRR